MELRPPDEPPRPLQVPPPMLDYGRPAEVVSLSAGAYVMATISAVLVFVGAFILLWLAISLLVLPMLDSPAGPILMVIVFILACAAAASSYRDSLKLYRKKKAKKMAGL